MWCCEKVRTVRDSKDKHIFFDYIYFFLIKITYLYVLCEMGKWSCGKVSGPTKEVSIASWFEEWFMYFGDGGTKCYTTSSQFVIIMNIEITNKFINLCASTVVPKFYQEILIFFSFSFFGRNLNKWILRKRKNEGERNYGQPSELDWMSSRDVFFSHQNRWVSVAIRHK